MYDGTGGKYPETLKTLILTLDALYSGVEGRVREARSKANDKSLSPEMTKDLRRFALDEVEKFTLRALRALDIVLGTETQNDMASSLYWRYGMVPVKPLAARVGMRVIDLKRYRSVASLRAAPCANCGRALFVQPQDRRAAEELEYHKAANAHLPQGWNFRFPLCGACCDRYASLLHSEQPPMEGDEITERIQLAKDGFGITRVPLVEVVETDGSGIGRGTSPSRPTRRSMNSS